jgi:hypothetical protein
MCCRDRAFVLGCYLRGHRPDLMLIREGRPKANLNLWRLECRICLRRSPGLELPRTPRPDDQ